MPQYRDINPPPLDINARSNADALTGMQLGRAAFENQLTMREVAHDDATRTALGNYLSSPPDQRDVRLNALVGASPEMAANVLTIEHAQADRAAAGRRAEAQATITELQAVMKSSNPGLAFQLMAGRPDGDNALRGLTEQLVQMGVINLEDGISDEEARTISELAIGQLEPIAGAQDVERADPADVRAMQLLGYDLTPEGFAKYNADKGQPGDTAADTLAALQAELAMDERRARIERDRKADEAAAKEAEIKRTTLRNTVRRSIAQTGKIAELTEKLEGSFLEAGMPAASWRRTGAGAIAGVGSALGLDTTKLRGDLDAYDQLKKNLSDQLINLMSTGGLGEATNSKLEQYQNALASTETSPGAIMAIQANIAQTLLDEADNQGFEVFDRDKVEANIDKWHGYATPAAETVVDVPAAIDAIGDIATATIGQIRSIDLEKLTEKQREALAKRLDELGL